MRIRESYQQPAGSAAPTQRIPGEWHTRKRSQRQSGRRLLRRHEHSMSFLKASTRRRLNGPRVHESLRANSSKGRIRKLRRAAYRLEGQHYASSRRLLRVQALQVQVPAPPPPALLACRIQQQGCSAARRPPAPKPSQRPPAPKPSQRPPAPKPLQHGRAPGHRLDHDCDWEHGVWKQ